MNLNKWSEEEKEYIFANYKGVGPQEMAQRLSKKFGKEYTRLRVKCFYGNHKLSSGLTGRFETGNIPYIDPLAGRRPGSVATHFKKGRRAENTQEVGTILKVSISKTKKLKGQKQYLKIKVGMPDKWKMLHIYNWEKVNGPVKKNEVITFLDGNPFNCDISNLRKITRTDNALFTTLNIDRNFGTEEVFQASLQYVRLINKIRSIEKGKRKRKCNT